MLQVDDAVQFVSKPPPFKGEPFSIIFEDDDLVVVDKPSGLLSVARDTGEESSVHSYLKDRYKKTVYVVHRLDQETSGLILFARTYDAYIKLKEELKERKIKRCYEAVLEGQLEGKGIWQCYLKEEGHFRVLASDNPYPEYEYAVTGYRVLKSSMRYTRVECQLQTGKNIKFEFMPSVQAALSQAMNGMAPRGTFQGFVFMPKSSHLLTLAQVRP